MIDNYIEVLQSSLLPQRFLHSMNVGETAVTLAEKYGASPEKAQIAGILHDCAREYKTSELPQIAQSLNIAVTELELRLPILLHASIGAQLICSKYGVTDKEIIQAVRLHTTGGEHMSLLDKIIYLADVIEPGRQFPKVESLRQTAAKSLDEGMLLALDCSIEHVIAQRGLIHPDTVLARNSLLLR